MPIFVVESATAQVRHLGDTNNPAGVSCASHLEEMYNFKTIDKYDPQKISEKRVEVSLYNVDPGLPGIFGGRKHVMFLAGQMVYENGNVRDRYDIPYRYCVLDDNNRVLGLERERK